jgi:repressor LexA
VNNKKLTLKQQRVLDFIVQRREERGLSPSSREIQEYFGFRSQTAAMGHLRALERKGVLTRQADTARSWRPTAEKAAPRLFRLPIYGTIPAGLPADQEQTTEECLHLDAESFSLPRGPRVFGLRVQGDSMIGAHIVPGDVVIMEFRPPRHGEIVAALVDGETTLKRYLVQKGRPFLRAENPRYPDLLPARELVIQGVLCCVVRFASGGGASARNQD